MLAVCPGPGLPCSAPSTRDREWKRRSGVWTRTRGEAVAALEWLKGDMVFAFAFYIYIHFDGFFIGTSWPAVMKTSPRPSPPPPTPCLPLPPSLGVFLTSPAAATKHRGAIVPFCLYPPTPPPCATIKSVRPLHVKSAVCACVCVFVCACVCVRF